MLSLRRLAVGIALSLTMLTDAWADKGDSGPTFDKNAATAALSSVDLTKCRTTNAPKGEGHVFVTFNPDGSAKDAVLDRGPMLRTPVAKCITRKFKQAKIPPFRGDPVVVGKIFRFE